MGFDCYIFKLFRSSFDYDTLAPILAQEEEKKNCWKFSNLMMMEDSYKPSNKFKNKRKERRKIRKVSGASGHRKARKMNVSNVAKLDVLKKFVQDEKDCKSWASNERGLKSFDNGAYFKSWVDRL